MRLIIGIWTVTQNKKIERASADVMSISIFPRDFSGNQGIHVIKRNLSAQNPFAGFVISKVAQWRILFKCAMIDNCKTLLGFRIEPCRRSKSSRLPCEVTRKYPLTSLFWPLDMFFSCLHRIHLLLSNETCKSLAMLFWFKKSIKIIVFRKLIRKKILIIRYIYKSMDESMTCINFNITSNLYTFNWFKKQKNLLIKQDLIDL